MRTALAALALWALPLWAGAASATPPPQIYHIITTPLCARLHDRIRPAVGLILENDRTIARSRPLFDKYSIAVFGAQATAGGDAVARSPSSNDSIYADSPATRMALQRMSYLVSPIAQSILAAQSLLGGLKTTGHPDDDRQLTSIRQHLLETVALQSASLDLINGFVATQQMDELQHAGETYLGAMNGSDLSETLDKEAPSTLEDPNAPGLPPNPYAANLAAVPGLIVGYNPLSRIVSAMQWLRSETDRHENDASASIGPALAACKT